MRAPTVPGPLLEFVERHRRLLVLTGAGCSTASGIPDYRDHSGAWKSRPPVRYADFVASAATRQRYWARSLAGFSRVARARPNPAHQALARLEALGRVRLLVTQNVDGLHQRAGSRRVLDLHGRLDLVECLDCGLFVARSDLQELLRAWNPAWADLDAAPAPDGDARLEGPFDDFRVPDCPRCAGLLKPAVVFFGENVPRPRVDDVRKALQECDALLVVGSSLMVFSGYRFCLLARELEKPVAALNLGRTRADELLDFRLVGDCQEVLPALVAGLEAASVA